MGVRTIRGLLFGVSSRALILCNCQFPMGPSTDIQYIHRPKSKDIQVLLEGPGTYHIVTWTHWALGIQVYLLCGAKYVNEQ